MPQTYAQPEMTVKRKFTLRRGAAFSRARYQCRMKFRIKKLRLARNMKQLDLALSAGVRVATLSELENGIGNPQLETLEGIAAALNVSVVELFSDTGRDPRHDELVAALDALTPAQRDAVLALVKRD